MSNPTIVVANLDDAELKASIDRMVSNLNSKLNEMTLATDAAVRKMQASLQSVGNVKFGGENDGGSTRRTKKQQEETDAVKQTAKAYDQLAQTQQKSTQVKSARESYYAFVQGYKEQAKALNVLVQQAEGAYSQAVGNKIMQLNMRLNDTRKTMQELHNEFQRERVTAMSTGDMTRVNALLERIRNVGAQIERLKAELASVPTTMLVKSDEGRRLQALRDEHSRILNIMREEVSVQQQQNTSVNNQISAQERLANKIRRQAEIIRERFNASGTGTATWGNAVIYDPNDARNAKIKQARLSIEDQLLQKHQEQVRVTNERLALEERERQAKQQTLGVTQQLAGAEQKVTEAQEKRSNTYQPKTFQSYDDLRESIAHVLKVRTQDVNLANAETASYDRLNASLKIMQQAYNKLGANDRASEQGRALAASIQEVQRALHKIQSQASRPVRLENILGFQPKTLDDIAYKIQMLQRYREGIDFTNPKTKGEIEQVNQALEKLRQEQSKILGQNKEMLASNNALVRSFNYMKNRLAFYFTVGASTQFVKSLIDIRSQYEMNERALGILINSAERGTQIFKELSEMALVSPYTLIELSSAAKQLVAYDIAAKDVVDTTRRLADMASAVGVPMERLTYALGQIKAYGYLNSRDARMFANAGIPLVKQLADYYTQLEGKMVSTADIYDRMKKKAIDYNDVMAVVTKMTDEGGKFFDFQAKMAETLKVRLANLTLAWNNMMNEIGESHQGLLTGTIGTLKELFLHWRDINQILHNLIYSFGLLKIGQIAYLAWIKKAGLGLAAMEVAGRRLTNIVYSLGAAMKTLITNPLTWIFVAISAGVSMLQTWSRNKEEIEKLNKAIADGAKESAEALGKMLQEANMIEARTAAGLGNLSNTEGMKVWEKMREQIELSSLSAKDIIPSLLNISDINKRVTESFNLAERIADANSKLSDLEDKLDMSQDTILKGLFGEGLIEDIEDYSEHMSILADNAKFAEKTNRGFWESLGNLVRNVGHGLTEALGSSTEEAEREIRNFAIDAADVIKEELGEEGIKDNVQVGEAVARVIKEIEKQYPQIKGAGKKLFESIFNDVMAGEFQGVFSKTAYYQNVFLEQLKKDYGSTFRGITDSIIDESHKWSKEQQTAIDKTVAKMKKDMPESAQSTINQIVHMLNTTEFKLKFVAEFSTSSSDFQKEFLDRIKKLGVVKEAALKIYTPQTTEELPAWTKKQQDAIAALGEENKKYEKDSSAFAKRKIAANKAEIANRTEALALFKQSALKDKELNKLQRAAETELQKALKEELQLIEKVRSAYKELTKAGVTHAEAIESAISGYGKSVANINSVLRKYGLELDLTKFVGTNNPHEMLAMLQKQLNTLVGKAKPTEIQALEVEIQKIKLDVDKFDATQVTEGLNRELGKIKDEYELALELDANPELGSMFADMFGIDTDSLPQTFAEAFDKANKVAMEKLQELKVNIGNFDLMSTAIKPDEEGKWMGLAYDSTAVQELVKAQKEWRDVYRKNLESTEKLLDDYVKKYGDYSDKIAEIEAKRLAQIKELNNAYYSEEMRSSQEYRAKLNAINTGAEKEKGQAKWDEFKNSTLYITMFENLEYASTKTLEAIHSKLEELKGELNTLTPEQLKQVTDQYLKIEQQLMKRNPFKGLSKNAKEYAKAIGSSGKAAQRQFSIAQDRYNKQVELVAGMKEEKKQMEANNDTQNDYYRQLVAALAVEDKNLEARKKELIAAQKLVEKYDLMRKIFKQQASSIGATMKIIGDNLQGIAQFRDTLNSLFGIDASKGETLLGHNLDGVIDGLSKTGQAMSQIVDSATSGNVFGVVGGVVNVFAGIGDSIASIFGGGSAKTKKLNAEINKSVEVVRKLSLAYKDLERAVETEMGSAELQARRQEMVNKEAQMRELQRQKNLEAQKRGKDRDDDRIKELESAIKDLQIELAEMADEIAATLLGSKVKDAAEEFVSTWVDAWRAGEDTMAALNGKFDDMIDNMIMKSVASRVVANRLQKIWDTVDEITSDDSEGGASVTMNELQRIKDLIGDKSISEAINDDLKAIYGALGIAYGSGANKELSALQQGLQGMSEDTAGALEAYMNNVSQQVYLQSDLLVQIRDAILGFDVDIQTATLGQILLQLQNSYQVQMSIQNMLEGALNPSGRAFMVELNS